MRHPWLFTRRALLATACAAMCFAAASDGAGAATLTEFDIPTAAAGAEDITLGPDGNLYFTEKTTNKIGRIVPGDPPTITDFDVPAGLTSPHWITVGPDGNLWFNGDVGGAGGVGRVSPATGTGQAFGGFGVIDDQGVAAGFDGRIWLLDASGNGKAVRIEPATGTKVVSDVTFADFGVARGIARGPDGNMWAASFGGHVARIPPNGGTPTEFTTANAWDILAGPDGFVYYSSPDTGVGRMNPATGAKTEFKPSDPAGDLFGMAVGPDGGLWTARAVANDIATITTGGSFSFLGGLTAAARPEYIAAGPANTLWFTERDANKIGRITGIVTPPGGGTGTPRDTTAPTVTGLGMTDRTLVVGPKPTPRAGTSAKTGATIRYTLSEAGAVTLRFERVFPGRRVGRRCLKPRRSLRGKRRCKRYKLAGSLTRASKRGKNSVRFSGRIGNKPLKRGQYRLLVGAADAAGNKAKARALSFRVVKPAKRKRARR